MDQRYEKRWQRSCPQKADSTPLSPVVFARPKFRRVLIDGEHR